MAKTERGRKADGHPRSFLVAHQMPIPEELGGGRVKLAKLLGKFGAAFLNLRRWDEAAAQLVGSDQGQP